jgi:hypothetical protein
MPMKAVMADVSEAILKHRKLTGPAHAADAEPLPPGLELGTRNLFAISLDAHA